MQPMTSKPPVAIIMGSQSDWPTMKHAAEILDQLDIGYEALIISAHRTPDRMVDFAKKARANGFKTIIAGAGAGSPPARHDGVIYHVAGVSVSPCNRKRSRVRTALLSIVQMPAGIPVGTLAIGVAGATNAALLCRFSPFNRRRERGAASRIMAAGTQ